MCSSQRGELTIRSWELKGQINKYINRLKWLSQLLVDPVVYSVGQFWSKQAVRLSCLPV